VGGQLKTPIVASIVYGSEWLALPVNACLLFDLPRRPAPYKDRQASNEVESEQ
jgi:hypothetical protein